MTVNNNEAESILLGVRSNASYKNQIKLFDLFFVKYNYMDVVQPKYPYTGNEFPTQNVITDKGHPIRIMWLESFLVIFKIVNLNRLI
jgi:hypothetical protein